MLFSEFSQFSHDHDLFIPTDNQTAVKWCHTYSKTLDDDDVSECPAVSDEARDMVLFGRIDVQACRSCRLKNDTVIISRLCMKLEVSMCLTHECLLHGPVFCVRESSRQEADSTPAPGEDVSSNRGIQWDWKTATGSAAAFLFLAVSAFWIFHNRRRCLSKCLYCSEGPHDEAIRRIIVQLK